MTQRSGIFPTFFLSGFECSTFEWGDKGRRDLSAELQHYAHADGDYAMLGALGLETYVPGGGALLSGAY